LVQLLAPATLFARLTLMLWALANGDEELARAHAKPGAISYKEKLLRRLSARQPRQKVMNSSSPF
jgi:hypothetical protein